MSVPLSEALKQATRLEHDGVDHLVMSVRPFSSEPLYQKFLAVQARFHGALVPLYEDGFLNERLPGLRDLQRASLVQQDLADLGAAPVVAGPAIACDAPEEAFGWLYCAEGSNVGAAFLLKTATALGMHESHGARHLAAHADGRARHWKAFVEQLNALALTPEQTQRAIQGAKQAFAYYRGCLQEHFPNPPADAVAQSA